MRANVTSLRVNADALEREVHPSVRLENVLEFGYIVLDGVRREIERSRNLIILFPLAHEPGHRHQT